MIEPKIIVELPPVYDNARIAFKFNPRTTLFAYGDIIYNPGNVTIPDDIMAHEMVHLGQQNYNREDAALWWGKYLRDPQFRLQQEVEAYGKQYWFICKYKTQNKQLRFNMLKIFGQLLSGPLYAECVGFSKAKELIKEEAKKHDKTPVH